MERRDFDPRLSPLLGELIERRRRLVDLMARQPLGEEGPDGPTALIVQLGMLQGCILAITEVVAEAKTTATLERP